MEFSSSCVCPDNKIVSDTASHFPMQYVQGNLPQNSLFNSLLCKVCQIYEKTFNAFCLLFIIIHVTLSCIRLTIHQSNNLDVNWHCENCRNSILGLGQPLVLDPINSGPHVNSHLSLSQVCNKFLCASSK